MANQGLFSQLVIYKRVCFIVSGHTTDHLRAVQKLHMQIRQPNIWTISDWPMEINKYEMYLRAVVSGGSRSHIIIHCGSKVTRVGRAPGCCFSNDSALVKSQTVYLSVRTMLCQCYMGLLCRLLTPGVTHYQFMSVDIDDRITIKVTPTVKRWKIVLICPKVLISHMNHWRTQ